MDNARDIWVLNLVDEVVTRILNQLNLVHEAQRQLECPLSVHKKEDEGYLDRLQRWVPVSVIDHVLELQI